MSTEKRAPAQAPAQNSLLSQPLLLASTHATNEDRQELPDGTLIGQIVAIMSLSPDPFVRAAGEHLQEVDEYHKPNEQMCDSGCPICDGCDFSWQTCWPCSEWMSGLRLGVAWLITRSTPEVDPSRLREQARLRKQRQRDKERDVTRDTEPLKSQSETSQSGTFSEPRAVAHG